MKRAFKILKDLFENHKLMRRIILFWWMWLFTHVTLSIEFDATSYGILSGISGLMIGYYFHTRAND